MSSRRENITLVVWLEVTLAPSAGKIVSDFLNVAPWFPWLWGVFGVAIAALILRNDINCLGMGLTPSREWRSFEADAGDVVEVLRRAARSPDATDEDRAAAMEATMRITSRVSRLGYFVFPSSEDPVQIEQWYRLMVMIRAELNEGGRRWYYQRKRTARKAEKEQERA